MKQNKQEAFLEGIKETLRVGLLAGLTTLAAMIATGKIDWRIVVVSGLVAVLKGADKFVHEDPTVTAKGLLPF